jgi:hypothetical protein
MLKELINLKRGGMILIVMGTLLSACAPEVSARPLYATACRPPTVEDNVYRQSPQSFLGAYYSTAFTDMDFNNPDDVQRYEMIQYEAIKLLATQTERWSDSIDIPLGNKYIRITITYLCPELVHTIILNHYLFRKEGGFINAGFNAEIISQMEDIASRNEHIFSVTLTASEYEQDIFNNDPLIIQLPLQSLVLTNSSNIRVIPQHDDHNLEERIDLTLTSAHGYISYPMAITANEKCEWLLNKANNTHVVISIPYIEINGTRYLTKPWLLEYVPLIHVTPNPNPGENGFQVDRNIDHYRPDKEPPLPSAAENAEYWEKLGRFIWYQTTLDP